MSEAIKKELLAIKDSSDDGMLHAGAALQWAKENPDSALYGALEWDNDKAADEYRLGQVRGLIRLHIVTIEGMPQMVSLSFDRSRKGGYRDVNDVLKSRDLSKIMLADALAELERVQARYVHVKELTSVWTEVRAAAKRRRLSQEDGAVASPI